MRWIFVLAFVLFAAYIVWRFFGTTPKDKSMGERIWLAAVAAVTSLAAAISTWFHSTP
jgi:flagellar biogenesis protein FliO